MAALAQTLARAPITMPEFSSTRITSPRTLAPAHPTATTRQLAPQLHQALDQLSRVLRGEAFDPRW